MRETVELAIDLIKPNRHQPRLEFNQDALLELAQSIRENGLIQPIAVRKVEDGYEIVAGERRYRACILAGYTRVPAIIMTANEIESAEMALVENIQRENLTAIEEAKAFKLLMEEHGMTQEDMAKKMGKSQSTIANKMRLLNLPDEIQEAVSTRQITERHARALLTVEPEKQLAVYKRITEKKLNVNQTEQYIKELTSDKIEKKKLVTKGFTRNQKIALNTIYQAVTMIKKMGIEVSTEEVESEETIELVIKFPK